MLQKMGFDGWKHDLRAMFGQHAWEGMDSVVWNMGRYVIKLMHLDASSYRNQRILMRRQGPFAKIRELRALGARTSFRGTTYVTALMVQDRMSDEHMMSSKPATAWHDGVDAWMMYDGSPSNAVEGVWVDTVDIRPISERHALMMNVI